MKYELINLNDESINFFNKFGKDHALLSASVDGKCNGMTVGWGGAGVMWRKNVFFCVVRPQRYTFEFCEKTDIVTLSFFDDDKSDVLKICGSKSGRDCDKFALAGITPVIGENGEVDFEESKMTLVGKKLYAQEMREECFIDKECDKVWYPEKDYHILYVYEIIEARRK